ncbi:MAG: ShlB/FhaC/HecB family hemolysin secretion/activation protein, partial [Verrucomicrobiota bacterium]
PAEHPIYIREYRVAGAKHLPKIAVEEAVYPFLGPGRTSHDVEQARAALEKAYRDKGFQAVNVEVPDQDARSGVVLLRVNETTVGRLRVRGARYFSLAGIKRGAPSMAEGKVVDFNEVTRDIVRLNRFADRRITPTLSPGVEPGTVDIDLTVKDSFPLHGSLELNNRNSPDTSALRLNGSLSYSNLWQLGHTLGASFQIAPQRLEDAKIFSAYYSVPIPWVDWLTLTLQGTKQDSNVSTLGGSASAGRGYVLGARATITLPAGKEFYESVTLGIDYKHLEQTLFAGGSTIESPIEYYPLSAIYSATWTNKGALTEFNGGITFHLRGLGSDPEEFDARRYNSQGSFFYFRGDLSHTRDLPAELELFAKVQGQLSGQPLVDSEQFSGGGLGTVRGYLESEAVGDNALFGSLELRSPSLSHLLGEKVVNEWRFYVFGEAGLLELRDPLPEQKSHFRLASVGVGTRVQLFEHFNGSLDAGLPLIGQAHTGAHDLLLTFRLWADF